MNLQGTIKELNQTGSSLQSLRIPDGAKLILTGNLTFQWDQTTKGPGIKSSNNNLTLAKGVDSPDYASAKGTLSFSSGKHYWEIRVDKCDDDEFLFVGVAKQEFGPGADPSESRDFMGYMCLG